MNVKRFARALLFCQLLLLLLQTTAWAQSKTVTGTVTDDKNSPIQGASVLVKGTTIGTATDASGNFSINVPATAKTLTITYVGYSSQDVSIVGVSTVSATLVLQQQSNLNEVVVIGYGTARKKDLTGSVASVTSKNFNQGVIAAPDQLLQNKVAGVEVTNNSGAPGSATTIKIRGNNSIRAVNNPLYVIDGVPLDGRTARPPVNLGTGGFGSTPDDNPLLFINPNDIAQIDILKDASAAAIYGSRGANGVIVITTKKGSGGPTRIDFSTNFSVNAGYMKKFEVLNTSEFRSALHKYNLDTITSSKYDFGSSTDALKAMTQSTLSQNYSVSLSGGNDNGKYRASFLGGRLNGFIKNSNLDKYLGSFAGTYKFLDKRLTIDFNFIAGHVTENTPLVSNTAGSQGNLISSAISWNPTASFYNSDGTYYFPTNGIGNPMATLRGYSDLSNVDEVLGNISAELRIIKGLNYKFQYAINHGTGTRNVNIDGFLQSFAPIGGNGFGATANAKLTSQTFTHTLDYNTSLTKDLNLEALAGFEYWQTNYSNNIFSALGFNTNLSEKALVSIPYTDILQDGKTQNLPGVFVDPRTELQSVFGRVSLNYLEKYFITGTLRSDGSSKFGQNNRYGYFPSVGAKWLISNESMFKNQNLLSAFGLRASYGITGNQEFPAGSSQEQFSFGAYNTAGQINVFNPNLKWEETRSYNIGLDYGFAKNRITGSIDYYNKNTTNILFQSTAIQPAPASQYFINLPAHLINSGIEFGISASVIDKKSFSWDVSGNFSYNHNILKDFYAAGTKTPLQIQTGQINGQGVSGTLAQLITNNQTVDVFYLKPFLGFDSAGNQKVGANPVIGGNPNPQSNFGFSTTLRYQKISLILNAGGAAGYKIYNNTATDVTNISNIANGGRNIDKNAYNSAEGTKSAAAASSRFLESGDFVKLRNATLRYDFGKIGTYIQSLSAYVSGTNLFVITKFSGFDPEVNIDKNNNGYPSRSIEYIPYPTPRVITFGVNIGL